MLSQKANYVLYEVHLGETVVKQNQFDILLAKMEEMNNNLNNKMDEGFNKVNHRLDVIESDVSELKKDVSELKKDMSEVKTILKKHDDAMVEHGWLNKSSF